MKMQSLINKAKVYSTAKVKFYFFSRLGWVVGDFESKAISASNLVEVELEDGSELGKMYFLVRYRFLQSCLVYPPKNNLTYTKMGCIQFLELDLIGRSKSATNKRF